MTLVFPEDFDGTLKFMEWQNNNPILRSANLDIHPHLGQVKVLEKVIRLTPVNMKVLMLLVENTSRVVSRNEFFEQIWKNQVVNDDTLTRCISDLRNLLGPSANVPTLIETLPKRGYRWIPEVSEADQFDEDSAIGNSHLSPTRLINWLLPTLVGLLLFTLAMVWYASSTVQNTQISIALLPILNATPAQQLIANNLEETLLQQILEHDEIRVLSFNALSPYRDNPFPVLASEFGTQWIIEGRIRTVGGAITYYPELGGSNYCSGCFFRNS